MHRAIWWLAALLGGYYAMQIALRVWLGSGLQLDEAELMVRAREWHWGYGPQLPLFNWIQGIVFAALGPTVLALALAKNACLWLSFVLVCLGLARLIPARTAALATLGLALMPEIAWEAQRTLSHSVALILTCALFLFALAGVLRRGAWGDWLLLGLALGLGGLSKYNFWLLPLASAVALWSLRPVPWRNAGLRPERLGGALLVALLVLAGPWLWIAQHPEIAFASSTKIYRSEGLVSLPFVGGFVETLVAFLLALILAVLVGLAARFTGGRATAPEPAAEATVWVRRFLLRSAVFGAVLLALAMGAADASRVTPRWLIPIAMPGAVGVMLWSIEAGRRAAPRIICAMAGVVGVAVLAGIFVVFGVQPSRLSHDIATLRDQIAPMLSAEASHPVTRIEGDQWLVGSLAVLQPDWPISQPPPLGPAYAPAERVLEVRLAQPEDKIPPAPSVGANLLETRQVAVPDRLAPDHSMAVALRLWQRD